MLSLIRDWLSFVHGSQSPFSEFRSQEMLQMRLRFLVGVLLLACHLASATAHDAIRVSDPDRAAYRAPCDVVYMSGLLLVANSKSGTISILDAESAARCSEWKVAESLVAMQRCGRWLLALDPVTHQLIVIGLDAEGRTLHVQQRLALPRYPQNLAVDSASGQVAVASLWSRTVTFCTLSEAGRLMIRTRTSMPFAPGRLLFTDSDRLVVADNFGGEICVLQSDSGQICRTVEIDGHNIRGLAVNPKTSSLMVTCQTLDSRSFSTYEHVFWGVLMQNGLHSIPLVRLEAADDARDSDPESLKKTETATYGATSVSREPSKSVGAHSQYPLGTPSIGSGDPGAMVVTSHDATLLVISGTNQLAFRTASHLPFERLKTGRRPEAICLDENEDVAFVANRFEDSISVISLTGKSPEVIRTFSLGAMRQLTTEEQGEQLFYDATVSLDGWYSCHSCHTDGHTNGRLADTFGDESKGAPKKVTSLLGTADTAPWAWNGSRESLEDQVRTSLIISMQTQVSTEQLPIEPLTAFVRSLPPAPSVLESIEHLAAAPTLSQARHEFVRAGCSNCHAGNAYTTPDSVDVGLVDEIGSTHFNPPSLRGVSQRGPWFHDGRATTLQEVLRSGHHAPESPLTPEQVSLLELLLKSL